MIPAHAGRHGPTRLVQPGLEPIEWVSMDPLLTTPLFLFLLTAQHALLLFSPHPTNHFPSRNALLHCVQHQLTKARLLLSDFIHFGLRPANMSIFAVESLQSMPPCYGGAGEDDICLPLPFPSHHPDIRPRQKLMCLWLIARSYMPFSDGRLQQTQDELFKSG